MAHSGEFLKLEVWGQIVLPDWSILIEQKLVENAKIENLKCDFLIDFQEGTLNKIYGIYFGMPKHY